MLKFNCKRGENMTKWTEFDKKSSKKSENDDENESELIKNLKNDEKLREDPDKRMGFLSMAGMFLDGFADNIYKTSIEMNEKIPYFTIDAWRDFLNYPIVRKYIKAFKDEKINMMADQGLAEGDKNAVSIKKAIQEGGPSVNNSNIVLIRLPEKKDFDD
jgi:hypothetical protein